MPDTTPADQLRAAAGHAPSPELARLLATLADASDHHALGEGGAVATVVHPALAVARRILGTSPAEGRRSPAASLAEVWTVWRADNPTVYGHFATVDAARQGTIDCWQEDKPVCPDYSWRPDGPRLELVVGGEPAGVYASRYRVYGTPPAPADRAAVLREAADLLSELGTPIFGERSEHERGLMYGADRLRRLAGEAAAGAHQTEQAHRPQRGDAVAQWLRAQREAAADYPEAYQVTDGLLDLYRLHADMGIPLDGHACEARVIGDCECLETPAAPAAPEEQAR
ncbi:hypothetical protein ACIQH0_38065 [Streptomyces griseus]|uniref:hypothetical protein n=1 Tax=Streptomyces griseus TaxID=1911 RepID=UPI003804374F